MKLQLLRSLCPVTLVGALSIGSISEVLSEPVKPPGIDNLRDRPVRVELLSQKDCRKRLTPDWPTKPTEEAAAVLPALGAILIPPLIEAGVKAAGSTLTYLSGKDRELKTLTGLANGYFYNYSSVANAATANIDCIRISVQGNALPKQKDDSGRQERKNETLYEALIDLRYSDDGTAMYMQPRYVMYPKPLTNIRAVGTALEINISDTDKYSSSTPMLMGKGACGKVGGFMRVFDDTGKLIVQKSNHKLCDAFMAGPWIPIPSSSKTVMVGRSKPVIVRAVLWEVSDYDKILSLLGSTISLNSGKLKDALAGQLPYSVYTPNYDAEAKLSTSKSAYLLSRATYIALLSQVKPDNPESCKSALTAWADMITKSIAAGEQAPEVNRPPKCF
jgi:hypothetical protein